MQNLVLATHNEGKAKEIKNVLHDLPFKIVTLNQFENVPEVEEDGATFKENALKKARTISNFTQEISLADDSGLVIDSLDGLPGVKSARFAGEDASDSDNNLLLMEKLEGIPEYERKARFVCVLALAYPEGGEDIIEETCEGIILTQQRGSSGFGYDPLFYHEPTGLTFAQMDPELKNRVSHRGKALQQLRPLMEKLIFK